MIAFAQQQQNDSHSLAAAKHMADWADCEISPLVYEIGEMIVANGNCPLSDVFIAVMISLARVRGAIFGKAQRLEGNA